MLRREEDRAPDGGDDEQNQSRKLWWPQVVTCWTCHRGSGAPPTTPTIDSIYSDPISSSARRSAAGSNAATPVRRPPIRFSTNIPGPRRRRAAGQNHQLHRQRDQPTCMDATSERSGGDLCESAGSTGHDRSPARRLYGQNLRWPGCLGYAAAHCGSGISTARERTGRRQTGR